MDTDYGERVAVVEAEIKGLREQQKSHYESLDKKIDRLSIKQEELVGLMNRGKGAFAASVAIAAVIGGLGISFLGWLGNKIWG